MNILSIKAKNDGIFIMCLYVDDLIYIGNDRSMFDKFKDVGFIE